MNHKYPDLNIRYAVGVGDLIASILHSKLLSWAVILITGNDKICVSCSKRKNALNILFPIKFWKLFFKDDISYLENLKDFYIKCGFNATLNYENKYVSVSKFEQVTEPNVESEEVKNSSNPNKIKDYIFLSSNEVKLGDHLIKTEYYKKL
jgi:hypothetical protein